MAKKKTAKKPAAGSRKPTPKTAKAAVKTKGGSPKKAVTKKAAKVRSKAGKPVVKAAKPSVKSAKKASAAKPVKPSTAKKSARKASKPAAKTVAQKPSPAPARKAASIKKEAAPPVQKAAKPAKPSASLAKPKVEVAKPAADSSKAKPAAETPAPAKAVAAAEARKTAPIALSAKVFSNDRTGAALGVSAFSPGGLPGWWRWHPDYPGEETLRRGTVLTSFNLYQGIYTDTLRIHMAAGQSGIRAVSYSSKFAIDGDGSGGKQKGDEGYKDDTSLHLNDGQPPSKKNALNSLEYPFAVLPLPPKSSSIPDFRALGLDMGDIGIAFFGRGHAAPFIYGDEGTPHQVGEGSVAMAKDLGMDWEGELNTTPANGGFGLEQMRKYAPGVLHIAFPGSRDRPDRTTDLLTRETLQAKAWELFKRWRQSLRGGPV